MVGGKYTTCDEHEHPHFYIQMTKAKVRPKKKYRNGSGLSGLGGRAVVSDRVTFLFLPVLEYIFIRYYYADFGDESTRGFFLRDGGYYFALSDYMDLALLGEIYTKGSWGLSLSRLTVNVIILGQF